LRDIETEGKPAETLFKEMYLIYTASERDGAMNELALKTFLHSLQIFLTDKSISRIFSVIDFDHDGKLSWSDLYPIIFPDLQKKNVLVQKRRSVNRKDKYSFDYSLESSEHSKFGQIEKQKGKFSLYEKLFNPFTVTSDGSKSYEYTAQDGNAIIDEEKESNDSEEETTVLPQNAGGSEMKSILYAAHDSLEKGEEDQEEEYYVIENYEEEMNKIMLQQQKHPSIKEPVDDIGAARKRNKRVSFDFTDGNSEFQATNDRKEGLFFDV
jgi:hypothetical protein